jgi:hypothetical protein
MSIFEDWRSKAARRHKQIHQRTAERIEPRSDATGLTFRKRNPVSSFQAHGDFIAYKGRPLYACVRGQIKAGVY